MTRIAFVVALAIGSLSLAVSRADDPKALEGTWLPADGVLAGEKLPDDFIKSITVKMGKDSYSVTVGDTKEDGKYTLDEKKKPKEMDIKPTDGPNKGKTILAIYELDGDTFKVCYELEGKARPTEFKSTKENNLFLVTYKRKK